ncbi:chloride channel protein [Micropruina sonneratiae]|uniref:chloride channel protein n=1 Tax=Micropruina sonneratiae TaxID=2986940 RepID=UPI002225F600|nr:chloride channel protein [Micropruina sp. KQZ13P-5]MCW3157059.1 chloride channel protein [Micropruina sp. KQZ13P-5]
MHRAACRAPAGLGPLWGAIFHQVLTGLGGAAVVAVVGDSPIPFALVGMAALFTATVRAPPTGVVLIIEMSGTASLTTATSAAAAAALFAAVLLKGPAHLRLVAGADAGRRDSPAGVASGS